MKKVLTLFTTLLIAGTGVAMAAQEPFNINMVVRAPVVITEVSALDFGGVDRPGAGSTVFTVTAASGAQPGAGVGASAAEFSVTGEAGYVADVSFLANPVTITDGTTNTSVTLTTSAATVTFPAANVFVGGSLTVNSTDTIGTYTGTATLTIIYQ